MLLKDTRVGATPGMEYPAPDPAGPKKDIGKKMKRHQFLDKVDDIALLLDAMKTNVPIVSVSHGFQQATGYTCTDVFGSDLETFIAKAPAASLSRSEQKSLNEYCLACTRLEVLHISETAVVQPVTREDGSHFMCMYLAGLCEIRSRPYVLVAMMDMGVGLGGSIPWQTRVDAVEQSRQNFIRIRHYINGHNLKAKFLSNTSFASSQLMTSLGTERQISSCSQISQGSIGSTCRPRQNFHWSIRGHRRTEAFETAAETLPAFAFFSERLQSHSILTNEGYSAARRECKQLQSGSLVFSDKCLKLGDEGYEFSLLVDAVEPTWSNGLPLLGFTRRRPTDSPDLYPKLAKGLGQSVLIGLDGKAFARDQHEHYVMGFKPPTSDQISSWSPGLPKTFPPKLSIGDLLRCVYTRTGLLQVFLNSEIVLEVDVERPIDPEVDYFAVVDVCFNVSGVSVCSSHHGYCNMAEENDDYSDIDEPSSGSEDAVDTRISHGMEWPGMRQASCANSTSQSLPSLRESGGNEEDDPLTARDISLAV